MNLSQRLVQQFPIEKDYKTGAQQYSIKCLT